MLVKEFMKLRPKNLITTNKDTNILKAMNLLIEKRISCLPIIDENNKLIGILSDKDIFRAVHNNHDSFIDLKVKDLMTKELIVGIKDDDINYIAGIMTKNRIRHVPIIEEDKLIGLVSIGDVVKIQMKDMEIENRYLKLYIDGSYPA
ncbi:MAG: CBS domain-containing protein [FCB group bacterium]|nr:CBS domain-containing protein [FCB group bacterium]